MANSSVVFERCYSQSPWTKPSIASLFTGYLPLVHQAVLTSWRTQELACWNPENPDGLMIQMLRNGFDTVADVLAARGYKTALFQSSPHCQEEFGFAQGFQYYRFDTSQRPGRQVDTVLRWLRKEASEPFFIFVHMMDPHSPYTPEPSMYEAMFGVSIDARHNGLSKEDQELLKGFFSFFVPGNRRFAMHELAGLSPAGQAHFVGLYDAEIREVDYHFGRLLHYLSITGLDEDTVVVFIADHGEAFGEHTFYGHMKTLFNEELHVPLIMRLGKGQPCTRISCRVNLFDLYSTLVTLAGACPGAHVQSQTLLTREGAIDCASDRRILAYFDKNNPNTAEWQFCCVQDGHKLIDKGPGKEPELYDEAHDSLETNNLWGVSALSSTLATQAKRLREEHAALAASLGEAEYAGSSKDTLEQIQSLGYL